MFIEMRRLSDSAVYRFHPAPADDSGSPRFKRADKDVWMRRDADFGWIIWDGTDQTLMSRPWDIALKDQCETPPPGVWVSRKGANSYVYELVFV
jgi:hypothetical protein